MNAQPQPISTQPAPASGVDQSLLPGVNVLLEGPTGTGKTFSIGTLVDSAPHLQVFYLALESGMESLLGFWSDKNREIPANLHWHRLQASDYGWDSMLKAARDINSYTNDALAKLQDPNKQKHNQFIKLLECLSNFQDQRTGESFGPVDKWGPDCCLVIDALTGINTAAMSLVVGAKPIKSLVDWGIAMDLVERTLRQLTENCRCHFILLSHVERETDQVLGGVKITVGTLGTKLASKIPPMFSDVILAYREGSSFFWSTANMMADLKTRNLPIADKIRPDFGTIIKSWQVRGGRFTGKVKV